MICWTGSTAPQAAAESFVSGRRGVTGRRCWQHVLASSSVTRQGVSGALVQPQQPRSSASRRRTLSVLQSTGLSSRTHGFRQPWSPSVRCSGDAPARSPECAHRRCGGGDSAARTKSISLKSSRCVQLIILCRRFLACVSLTCLKFDYFLVISLKVLMVLKCVHKCL